MMKKAYNIIAAFAALAVVFSCAKEIDTPAEEPVVPGNGEVAPVQAEEITISASLSDVLTKVGFEPAYSGNKPTSMALTWTTGDIIRVYDHADRSKYDDFTLKSECDGQKAGEFTGTPSNIGSAAAFDVEVYNASAPDYAAQSQPSDGVTTDLKYLASASNIGDYSDISFTEFSSILAITAKMPSTEVAAKIKSVDITASEDIFNGGNAMTITFDSIGDADADGILHFFATLPQGGTDIPAGTTLLVHFNAPDEAHDVYTRFIELPATTFTANKLNTINIDASASATHAGLTSCDGSNAAKAYLIGDKYQMLAVKDLMVAGSTKYFKLIDDIDLDGESWTKLNPDPFTKVINLDGNGKTISNLGASLFDDLNGTVANFTIKDATVSGGSAITGILANTIKTASSTVTNVDITGTSTSAPFSSTVSAEGYTGGLIGQTDQGATISGCNVSYTSVSGTLAGGVIGFANSLVTVSDCSFSGGTVTASARYCGGFVGSTGNYNSIISSCSVEDAVVTSTVTADARCGGFVGQLQTKVQVKGCTVGTEAKKVVVNTAKPGSGNVLNAGGFVGVNYGTITKNGDVRSKAYVQVKSANDLGQQINIGGFAGFHRGTIEFCDAVVDMSDLQGQYIGGFSGYMPSADSKADNCTLAGSVRGNNYTGGFVGVVDNATSITNCHVLAGTTVVGQSTAGGFAAQIKAGTVEDCSANVDMQCRGGNDGGFVGALTGGTVQRCSSAGTLSRISGTNSTFGGFAGYVDGVNLTKCSSTVNIVIASKNVGGLVGDFKTANAVRECYYNGTISGPSDDKGGLIGVTQAAVTITNCYTAGTLIGSSGTQRYGGIVAELAAGGSVTNCYSTMDFSHGGRATGGIVGRACSKGWDVSSASGNTISNCIAWNPNITFDADAGTSASSGAIVGYTSFKNILNNCYRRYDMVYKNSNTATGTTCQTSMVDQTDCDGTNWAINGTRPAGGTPAGTSADAQYQAPYYGVAAAANATVSSIAQSLGWSDDVWDFTGDLPTLK